MDITRTFTFVHTTKVVCGLNSSAKISEELAALGCKKPLIVTDKGISGAGLLESISKSLEASQMAYQIFDEVEPNPIDTTAEKGTTIAKEGGFDSVIAVGGGSSIDSGKVIAMLVNNPGRVRDYEGVDVFKNAPLPLIAVPTTVGTGSEVTRGAVITEPISKAKMVIVSVMLFPKVAILDPTLLIKLPAHITASTGMDSLTQAIEAYIATGSNPISDALNIYAVKLIAENLRPAVAGNNLEAFLNMQIATCMEGIAFHNAGLGLVHAMANTVGGHFNTPHGITNAILLPYVLEYNLIARPKKYAELAQAMGEKVENLSIREAAERFIEAVKTLSRDVGIPTQLRDIGVTHEALPAMAEAALTAIDIYTNPRSYSKAAILAIYEKAF
jgi:alcohol dehydrogenase class IV